MNRILRALPALAFVATFGLFFVDKTREATTVLSSGRGLLAVAAVVAGYVVVALVLRRLVRWTWAAPLLLTAVVLTMAFLIVRPYYVDDNADRRLVSGPVRDAPPQTAPVDPRAGEPMPQDSAPPSAAPEPLRVSAGAIQGIGHDAKGTVSIIRNPDGSRVVRFEDFEIEGTPDPRVYVVEGADVRAPGGVELGRLEGTRGRILDYAVPAGDAGPGWTVLVWCRSFSVPIANATQT